ncbi:MarR family winged helix-turn-helix transcriptional regulator (plasmid) [Streptomyces sp. AHU1]|uniref:MarR family winged helix-turn-helix transcriptional regulator n=1 Tax=Streptomyces sp. AHU1 TaxID=3377215 RepID=UPI003877EF9D
MTTEGLWLNDEQQRVWRRWLWMNTELPAALHRQLQADSNLSLPDFEVLVQLTDTPEGRVRVLKLARALGWEPSRLSHRIKRMAARNLVRREECLDDGRGAYVVLTPEGRTAIEQAAPAHVQTVKALVFDALTDAELAGFASMVNKVLTRLEAQALSGRS